MDSRDTINRRDFLVRTAGAAGTTSALVSPAHAQTSDPPPFHQPLIDSWKKPVSDVADVDLAKVAPELASESVKERHQIYCFLLMKLLVRFWNGNKRGPLGEYPRRVAQREAREPTHRYRGDMI